MKMMNKFLASIFGLIVLISVSSISNELNIQKLCQNLRNDSKNKRKFEIVCYNKSIFNITNLKHFLNQSSFKKSKSVSDEHEFNLKNKFFSPYKQIQKQSKRIRKAAVQNENLTNEITLSSKKHNPSPTRQVISQQKAHKNITLIFEDRNYLVPFCPLIRCEILKKAKNLVSVWSCMTTRLVKK